FCYAFYSHAHLLYLISIPTRRSSDLLIKIEKVVVATKPVLIHTETNTTGAGIDHVGTSFGPENLFWLLYLSVCGILMVKFFLRLDRKSTRLNSSHVKISYAVFCLKKK